MKLIFILIIVHRCDSQLQRTYYVSFLIYYAFMFKTLIGQVSTNGRCQSEKQNPGNGVWHFVALETGFSCRYYSAHKRGTEGTT